MMLTVRRYVSFACFLVFAEVIAGTLGEERCRGAGGRSCIDPSSRVLPMDATGSMLQVKASQSEETGQEGLRDNLLDGPQEMIGDVLSAAVDTVQTAMQIERSVEKEARKAGKSVNEYEKKAEDALEKVIQKKIQEEGDMEEELKEDVIEFEDAVPAVIDEVATEATQTVDETFTKVEIEGLQEVQTATASFQEKIDAAAKKLEGGFVAAGAEISNQEKKVESSLGEEASQLKSTLATAEEVIVQKGAGYAPNQKLYGEAQGALQQVIHPYFATAEATVDAEVAEVSGVMSAVEHETVSLGDEAKGIANTVKDAAREGVEKVAADVEA